MSDSLGSLLESIGIGSETAATIAPIATDAVVGAGLGAGTAAVTGGDPGAGALTGGLAGGGAGLGGAEFGLLGSTLGGAAGGGLGSLISGTSPVTGLLAGGVGGLGQGLAAGETFTGSPATATGGGTAAGGSPIGVDPAVDATTDAVAATPASGNSPSTMTPSQPQVDITNNASGVLDATGTAPTGGSGIGSFLSKNQNWLLPAAGLALTAGKQAVAGPSSAEKALSSDAAAASGIGQSLIQNGLNGTLPAGEQAYFTRLAAQKKAALRSQFANQGLSGSSMENTALSDVDSQIAGQIAQYSQNLLTAGGALLGTSGSDLSKLVQAAATQDQGYSQAIGLLLGGLGASQGRSTKAGVDPNADQQVN